MKRILELILCAVISCLIFSACVSTPSSDIDNEPQNITPTEGITQQAEVSPENIAPEEREPSDGESEEGNTVIISPPVPTNTSFTTPTLPQTSEPLPVSDTTQSPTPMPAPTSIAELPPTPSLTPQLPEGNGMTKISITIGSTVFSAKLFDNDTTKSLLEIFPLTVDMSELNGNEKYYYLPNSLSTDSQRVGSINAGDLMLYGSDCLVLFYESFTTPTATQNLALLRTRPALPLQWEAGA